MLGDEDGEAVGCNEGLSLGDADGNPLGTALGILVGRLVGVDVGSGALSQQNMNVPSLIGQHSLPGDAKAGK